MKKLIFLILLFAMAGLGNAQIHVSDTASNNYMVSQLCGPGISFSNITYTGDIISRGVFTNGSTTNLGMDNGIALTSGALYYIPGPNTNTMDGIDLGLPGNSLLTDLVGHATYDACIVQFDFIPAYDTIGLKIIFGSEEYPEWVLNLYNDVAGVFVSGPSPNGGLYENNNIAVVPGTSLPISVENINNVMPSYPEYYIDNTGGQYLEYDGFTVPILLTCAVVPDSLYHIFIGIADDGDRIYDSGIFLEAASLKSQAQAAINSFSFLSSNNPQLSEDIYGVISDTTIFLEVPYTTDLTNLIASFDVPSGVVVLNNGIEQLSGVTPNDFTDTLVYLADGSSDKLYSVIIDILPGPPVFNNYSFLVNYNPGLLANVYGTINDTLITLSAPYGTDISALVATFEVPFEVQTSINGIVQISDTTPNNFSLPVIYQLQGIESQEWKVVVEFLYGEPLLNAYSFLDEFNPQLPFDIIGETSDSTVHLLVPATTNLDGLIATFSTPLGVITTVEGVEQMSSFTPNDFNDTLVYTLDSYIDRNYEVIVGFITGAQENITAPGLIVNNFTPAELIITNTGNYHLRLYNMSGTRIYESPENFMERSITIGSLKPGVYLLTWFDEDKSGTRKIIVY